MCFAGSFNAGDWRVNVIVFMSDMSEFRLAGPLKHHKKIGVQGVQGGTCSRLFYPGSMIINHVKK